ncbi:MAG TPA: hypothetical protein VLJ86_15415 [Ramlibacter sp.]|nr:hypothetical protein [Ramlibacter sp.]
MQFNRSTYIRAAAIVCGLAALVAAPLARANDVYWSLGVAAAPGVNIGLSNARPVYVQPAPVYVQPAPVYVQPQSIYYTQPAPIYTSPRVVYTQAPIYVQPAPVYYGPPGHWKHRGHGHGHGHGHGRGRD